MKKVPVISYFKNNAQFSVTLTTNQRIHKSLKARKIEKTIYITSKWVFKTDVV